MQASTRGLGRAGILARALSCMEPEIRRMVGSIRSPVIPINFGMGFALIFHFEKLPPRRRVLQSCALRSSCCAKDPHLILIEAMFLIFFERNTLTQQRRFAQQVAQFAIKRLQKEQPFCRGTCFGVYVTDWGTSGVGLLIGMQ